MSPVPGPGRMVVALLGIALALTLAAAAPAAAQGDGTAGEGTGEGAGTPTGTNDTTETGGANDTTDTGGQPAAGGGDLGIPADAPQPADGKITRVLTFGVIEEGCPGGAPSPCFDITTLVANPGDVVVLHGDFRNSDGIHNIHVTEGVEAEPETRLGMNALHTVSFTMPDEGAVEFICDAHQESMVASVVTPAAALSAGGHASVPTLGVHFLAYWVGLIAFAILFVFYGAAFFLFKYNETNATTDHWDRSEAPNENKRVAPYAGLLAVILAVIAMAAVIYVAVILG